tara:strand:- start:26 stop:127 length:102 start_codon:yes stop_codon:yes gene_type:complete
MMEYAQIEVVDLEFAAISLAALGDDMVVHDDCS